MRQLVAKALTSFVHRRICWAFMCQLVNEFAGEVSDSTRGWVVLRSTTSTDRNSFSFWWLTGLGCTYLPSDIWHWNDEPNCNHRQLPVFSFSCTSSFRNVLPSAASSHPSGWVTVYLSVLSAILICSLTYFGRTSAFWCSLAMKNCDGKMMLHINILPLKGFSLLYLHKCTKMRQSESDCEVLRTTWNWLFEFQRICRGPI